VEAHVAQLFPRAVVQRMDADSMTRKDAFRDTLRAFRTGKIDILVGTQMIKQHQKLSAACITLMLCGMMDK
jgi:primosomal protein N' (replication factor Y)